MLCYDLVANILLGLEIIHDDRFIYDHDDIECILPIYNVSIIPNQSELVVNTNDSFKVYCPHCESYFKTTLSHHLHNGYGCPTCPPKYQDGIINNYLGSRYRALKTKEFRIKCTIIYNNKRMLTFTINILFLILK